MDIDSIVEVILPEYEYYINKDGKWIASGNYVRGIILDEVGDSGYRIKLLIKGEPTQVIYYGDLQLIKQ